MNTEMTTVEKRIYYSPAELEFWKTVYLQTINLGRGHETAVACADETLKHFHGLNS